MGISRFPDKPIRISQDHLDELDNGQYIATFKRDGWRAILVRTSEGDHQVWSRHDKRMDQWPDFDPKIMEAFEALNVPHDTQIDGEWERRRAGNREGANCITIFGVLRWEGKWMARTCEEERWAKTLGLPVDGEYLKFPAYTDSGFRAFFEKSKEDWSNEGIVLKLKKGHLTLNRKQSEGNRGWYKIKWRDGADGQTLTDF